MRAREPDHEGYVDQDGIKIGFEVFEPLDPEGNHVPTLLLLPTWTIIHSRFWKAQVPDLARKWRVVTYDGPGNGRSDRPLDPAAYEVSAQTATALSVLDAAGVKKAVVVALSRAAEWALWLTAHHADRLLGAVFIAPSLALGPKDPERARARMVFDQPYTSTEGWARMNAYYWLEHWDEWLEFFFSRCFTEPHSTKQIEDSVAWGTETTPEVLLSEVQAEHPDEETLREWAARVRCPVLVIHGDRDAISPHRRGQLLAEATGGTLVTVEGGGHIPLARDPVKVNLVLREFLGTIAPPPRRLTWTRGRSRRKRALYVSSPIGLGHAQRDVAVARALREHHPDLEIDWLAQHPVTRVLEGAGERIHPASYELASESAHIESESAEHDLHCFQAWRRMDEILVANFMMFWDVVAGGDYDLVVGDEAWEVDYFLHENPELKRFAYAWLTDFVGWLPMPDGGQRETNLTADYNAEMISHIARYPRLRDRAVFVGNLDDVVPDAFGPDLPAIREWTQDHYDFAGYVTGFDPAAFADRDALRADLGYEPEERVCIVTVGGSGVGEHLLRRVIDAYPAAKGLIPELRMVVVCGPRIDPASLGIHEGLEVHAYVHDLYRHLAACDLAVVQGGLTTSMELTATGRPFLYFPLRHHFEQNFHVAHRLDRYRAGRRMEFDRATPEVIAEAIAAEIGRDTDYRPVEADGADRAAAMLAEML